MDFSELGEVLVDLKKSPSYQIYKEFNASVNDEKYKDYCKTIPNSTDYKEVKELCHKFVRNVKEIADMDNREYRKNRCLHSLYWTYNEISKIFSNDSNKINESDILNKFYSIGKRIDAERNKYICSHYFIEEDFDERREEKDLHDYFKNYDTIKTIIPHNEEECKMFHTYLQHLTSVYDKQDCCDWWVCEDYFSCNPDDKPHVILNKLNNCKDAFPNKQPEQSVQSRTHETLGVFEVSQRKDRNLPSGGDVKEAQDTTHNGQLPFFGNSLSETHGKLEKNKCKIVKGQMGEHPLNSISCSDDTTSVENDGKLVEIQSQEDLTASESDCNTLLCNPRRSINIAVVVFGIMCILFFCYKMTPFGIWLRKMIHKKRKRKRKKYIYKKYKNELPDNEQKYLYINSYTKRMNLTYYPT
ncbi:PIR Superfamily Protein [Plasmodium ovale wallikeri]|uniref:PIR Superfamily Protein n=1 Tax=Plasmodium ovale wallikeri TaxID=864142 RepID=A0A1A9AGS4_PLAOA|nr:PIR Superfamily Protein [Plasmodium ovale wallikeri]SBT56477.1 PIR Superfamily Protein [Plasmodium ovale wallikeri]